MGTCIRICLKSMHLNTDTLISIGRHVSVGRKESDERHVHSTGSFPLFFYGIHLILINRNKMTVHAVTAFALLTKGSVFPRHSLPLSLQVCLGFLSVVFLLQED